LSGRKNRKLNSLTSSDNCDILFNDIREADFLCQNGLLLGAENLTVSLMSTERSPFLLEVGMAGVKGKNNPMYGKHHSEKSKQKMRKIRKSKNYIGENHPSWKGGKYKTTEGYIAIYLPKYPHCIKKNYAYEHRIIVERYINRYLKSKEQVHHLGERDDNRPHMLMAFVDRKAHRRFERNLTIKLTDIIFDGRKYASKKN